MARVEQPSLWVNTVVIHAGIQETDPNKGVSWGSVPTFLLRASGSEALVKYVQRIVDRTARPTDLQQILAGLQAQDTKVEDERSQGVPGR